MRNKLLIAVSIIALVSSASACGYFYWDGFYKSGQIGDGLDAVLMEFQQLDNNRVKEVVKVDRDPLSDYDRLAGYLQQAEVLKARIKDSGITLDESPEYLRNEAFYYLLLLDRKTELIERYKTTFSIVRNSRRYLPSARLDLNRIIRDLSMDSESRAGLKSDNQVIYDRIIDLKGGDQSQVLFLRDRIDELQFALTQQIGEGVNLNLEFIAHARVLVRHVPIKAEILDELLDGDLQAALSSLSSAYQRYTETVVTAKGNNFLVSLVVFVLLSFSVIALVLLRARSSSKRSGASPSNGRERPELMAYESMNAVDKAIAMNKFDEMDQNSSLLVHEANTSLRYLKANTVCLSRLFSDGDPASAHREIPRALQAVDISVGQLQSVVSSLQQQGDVVRPGDVWFDLNESAKRVMAFTANGIGPGITLIQKLCPDARMYGNPAEVDQMLVSLLTNAAVAIEQANRKRGGIEVSTLLAKGCVSITVKDNGCGMSDEQKARAIDLSSATPRQDSGRGLSIVRDCIHKHQAKIRAASHLGKGTAICVTFEIDRESASDSTAQVQLP